LSLVKSPKTLTSENIKNYRNKTTLGVSTGPQLTKRQQEMRNRGVFGGKRTRKIGNKRKNKRKNKSCSYKKSRTYKRK
jgi:hypothetical protein